MLVSLLEAAYPQGVSMLYHGVAYFFLVHIVVPPSTLQSLLAGNIWLTHAVGICAIFCVCIYMSVLSDPVYESYTHTIYEKIVIMSVFSDPSTKGIYTRRL